MKKFICLLLTLALALGLAACGSTDESKTPASAPGTSASTPSAPDEPITLTLGVYGKSNVTEWEENKLVLWLEEKTGYELDVQVYSSDGSERATQIAAQVAGGEPLPDIMYYFCLSTDLQNTYGKDGYLYDIGTFFDDDAFMARLADKYGWDFKAFVEKNGEEDIKQRYLTEGRNADGNLWGYPSTGAAKTDQSRNMLYINQSWLDKLGLEMPGSIDELETVLTAFITKDPNGNGKADEMGMVGSVNIARGDIPSWLINNYIYLNDNYMFNCDDAGKLYLPYDRDEYRQGIARVTDLYEKNLIDQLTWTIKESSELPPLFSPVDEVSKIGVFAGHISLRVTADNPTLFEYEPLIPFEDAYAAVEPLSVTYYSYISGESQHPEEAFEVLYLLSSPEGTVRQRLGEPGVDWEWRDCAADCEVCGGKGQNGDGKAIYILDQDAYSGQTDSTFANTGCVFFWLRDDTNPDHADRDVPATHQIVEPDTGEVTWKAKRGQLGEDQADGTLARAAENNPKNMVYKLIYSNEETERIDTSKTDILTYAKESRAKFITGEWDINDDKAWNAYVDQIHALGWDTLLECAQSAYDRMKG